MDSLSGDELRRWRLRLGLTQHDLARVIGVSARTVRRWESGEWTVPRMAMLGLALLAWEAEGYINTGITKTK